jgi:hypothetical protein
MAEDSAMRRITQFQRWLSDILNKSHSIMQSSEAQKIAHQWKYGLCKDNNPTIINYAYEDSSVTPNRLPPIHFVTLSA